MINNVADPTHPVPAGAGSEIPQGERDEAVRYGMVAEGEELETNLLQASQRILANATAFDGVPARTGHSTSFGSYQLYP